MIDATTLARALATLDVEPAGRLQLVFGPETAADLDAGAPAVVVGLKHDGLRRLNALLAERYPAEHPVRITTADDRVIETTVAGLGSIAPFAAEATVHVPAMSPEADIRDFDGLVAIIRRLRDPESGCPWDLAQTHETLKPHLLEETYETLGALDAGDPAALREELGDLLLQVVLHARIAEQQSEFELRDVIESINAKLLRRHPHVFGMVVADTAEQVAQNWEQLKRAEKDDDASALGGVPAAMPALAYSQAVLGRAERAGFRWPARADILVKVSEEASELELAEDAEARREELGDLLFALVSLARSIDVDAEEALRMAAAKFAGRFQAMERLAAAQGTLLAEAGESELRRFWEEAKRGGDAHTLTDAAARHGGR